MLRPLWTWQRWISGQHRRCFGCAECLRPSTIGPLLPDRAPWIRGDCRGMDDAVSPSPPRRSPGHACRRCHRAGSPPSGHMAGMLGDTAARDEVEPGLHLLADHEGRPRARRGLLAGRFTASCTRGRQRGILPVVRISLFSAPGGRRRRPRPAVPSIRPTCPGHQGSSLRRRRKRAFGPWPMASAAPRGSRNTKLHALLRCERQARSSCS